MSLKLQSPFVPKLYRYIFNREKLIKTKLSDKVLLPLYLDVQSFNGSQSESSKNKYYLCAIMRHKGTSAYSGHYVAETMDWRSGQWFEFNDAAVTHLKNGPSNCYDPSALDLKLEELTNHSKSNQLVGSTDAYNMYYIEESFLAHCILEKMRKQSDLLDEPPLCTSLMSKERSKYFDELSQ
jgi:Ubiquitin carboxyl-terminal hydrolase